MSSAFHPATALGPAVDGQGVDRVEAVDDREEGWTGEHHEAAQSNHRARRRVKGFASSSPFAAKAAYQTSVELSVYLAPEARGRRVGSQLLDHLLRALESEEIHRAYAGLTIPNPASERLVAAAGFSQVGLFREVGFKEGRYWDVAWYERPIPLSPSPWFRIRP